jgi:hypothetical protein
VTKREREERCWEFDQIPINSICLIQPNVLPPLPIDTQDVSLSLVYLVVLLNILKREMVVKEEKERESDRTNWRERNILINLY